MLLSYTQLLKLVKNGVVEHCPLHLVNGASIDVTLAPKILVESNHDICRATDYRAREPLQMNEAILREDGYCLRPGEFILAATEQVFHLPANVAAEYKLKSSMARIGLNHLNAGWADPTWHGSALTLELVNTTRYHSIIIRPGDRVGQVVFFRCRPVPEQGSYANRGRYNRHLEVRGIMP